MSRANVNSCFAFLCFLSRANVASLQYIPFFYSGRTESWTGLGATFLGACFHLTPSPWYQAISCFFYFAFYERKRYRAPHCQRPSQEAVKAEHLHEKNRRNNQYVQAGTHRILGYVTDKEDCAVNFLSHYLMNVVWYTLTCTMPKASLLGFLLLLLLLFWRCQSTKM